MELNGAKISNDYKKYKNTQIYIMSGNGQKDLLMEAENESEALDWANAIQRHIEFSNAGGIPITKSSIDRSNTCKFIDFF